MPAAISAAEFSDSGIVGAGLRCPADWSRWQTSRSIGSTRTICAVSAPGWSSCLRIWPRRRTLRREVHRRGKRIDVRRSMRASRTTGWEVLRLARARRRDRPRRVVLVCDVSRSMRPYAAIYLHLMRAAALRQNGIRPEVFAFSTSLTRLTPALSHRSAEVALSRANAKVVDRYGGTHLGRCVGGLLAAPHGSALRGAVVIVASDGWDSDPPEVLETRAGPVASSGAHGGLAQSARRTARIRTAGRIDGGRPAVLRSVSARALAIGFARPLRRLGWPGYSSTGATSPAERRRSNSARPTEMMPGRIDRNTISRIINSRLCLTNGTLPRK